MRPGPLEIVLIIAVIIAAVVIGRIFRANRTAGDNDATAAPGTSPRKAAGPSGFFRRTGITLAAIGIIAAIAGASLLQWALHSYIWSFILVVLGATIYILARKKG